MVQELIRNDGRGSIREDEIMTLHDLPGHLLRRDDEVGHAAEVDEHERPMLPRESCERSMQQRTKLVEISDDGQLGRRRWQPRFACLRFEKELDEQEEDEN